LGLRKNCLVLKVIKVCGKWVTKAFKCRYPHLAQNYSLLMLTMFPKIFAFGTFYSFLWKNAAPSVPSLSS
jgi:hypothetical protein